MKEPNKLAAVRLCPECRDMAMMGERNFPIYANKYYKVSCECGFYYFVDYHPTYSPRLDTQSEVLRKAKDLLTEVKDVLEKLNE